jgi:hypothetical protein
MISKREQALQGLFLCLQTGLPGISVLRNEVLTTAIPETGLVVLRDGDPGEPDILLSPPRYIYKHRADIEVFIQNADAAQRETELDQLITQIGAALETVGTLDGVIDILNPGSPELLTEPTPGAAAIKAATLPVTLEYVTANPLI